MLPDFPEIKLKIAEATSKFLQQRIRQEPLLSQIKIVRQFEGSHLSSLSDEGIPDLSSFKEFSSECTIKHEDVIEKGIIPFFENLEVVAEEMKKQHAQLMFQKIGDATQRTGNVVNGKGKTFEFDLFIQMLEKIWIEFDDNGNPFLPTMVVSPELGAKLKDKLPEWEANLDYKKKYDEVLARKKEQWNDRESNRKLVD